MYQRIRSKVLFASAVLFTAATLYIGWICLASWDSIRYGGLFVRVLMTGSAALFTGVVWYKWLVLTDRLDWFVHDILKFGD